MKTGATLRTRLVAMVVAAIVPLFALSVVDAVYTARLAVEHAQDHLKVAASLVAAHQERVTEGARQLLTAMVHMPEVQNPARPFCGAYFGSLNRLLSAYVNLGVIDPDGTVRCHGMQDGRAFFVGDRRYFQDALVKRSFGIGEYAFGRMTNGHVLTFALPALSREGQVTGVAFASVDLESLSTMTASVQLPKGARLLIADRRGQVLVARPENAALLGQPLPGLLLQNAFKNMRNGVSEGLDEQGNPGVFAFLPTSQTSDSAFFIVVSLDRAQVIGPSQEHLWQELSVLAMMALLGGGIAWWLGGRVIVGPTRKILAATGELEKGNFQVRLAATEEKGGGEFSKIAAGFNLMAQSLQKHSEALEAELAHSELVQEKLKDAQRLGRLGYWQLDLRNNALWWSEEVYDVLGLDRTHFDGTYAGLLRLIHPDDRTNFESRRDAAVQAGTPVDIEFRVVTSAGDERWIHYFGRVQNDVAGQQAPRRSGVMQDITERKCAELGAARTTELLNRTGEMALIGGWELMLDRMELICSDQVYRIYDIDPVASLPAEQALGFYAPEAQLALRSAQQAAVEHGQPWDMVLEFITSKGRRLQVRNQAQALVQDGKTVRLVGALQDVTLQQESLGHLKLLETALSRLNDLVLITDAASMDDLGPKIVFVNEAFERETGYSRAEVQGRSPLFLAGPRTRRAELDRIRAALEKRELVRAELINYRKDGAKFWLEIEIVPITDCLGRLTHFVSVARDISARKQADKALVDSERRYAALFDTTPVPMWIVDAQTHAFRAVNEACIQRYGYTREEFLSMTIFHLRSDLEAQRLRDEMASGASKKVNRRVHRCKDGSDVHVETATRVVDYEGRSARLVVAYDVSAQILAEHQQQEYLFTLQRAVDAAQAITWHQTLEATLQETVDQARGVIGAHKALLTLTGEGGTFQSMNAISLSEKYAASGPLGEASGAAGLTASMDELSRPIRLTHAELEAHPRWCNLGFQDGAITGLRGLLAVPLTRSDGQPIGLLQMTDKYEGDFSQRDIYVAVELAQTASIAIENVRLYEQVKTLNFSLEKKVAERTFALAREEALSRALTEQAPQVVWHANASGELTYVNRRGCELVGGGPEKWLGNQWIKAVHPDDRQPMLDNWRESSLNLSDYVGMRRVLAQDGSYHTMSYKASPVLNAQGDLDFWIGIDADVTEIKAIESALRLSNQELEAFSYSVSHDLRSPLNTIDGFSRLLAKQLSGSGNDKVQHYLSRIQAGAAQMGGLIEDMLSLAQVSRMELRLEAVNLSGIAIEILAECQLRQPERKVQIHVQDHLRAQGDSRLLRVVMENLLGNAWKFSGRQPRAEIEVGSQLDTAGIPVFFVRDNGAGFDMAYADKLFHTFQRLHGVAEFPGTGVGLAIVSRVIQRHGGRIWTESQPDHGATFFFTLPGSLLS